MNARTGVNISPLQTKPIMRAVVALHETGRHVTTTDKVNHEGGGGAAGNSRIHIEVTISPLQQTTKHEENKKLEGGECYETWRIHRRHDPTTTDDRIRIMKGGRVECYET